MCFNNHIICDIFHVTTNFYENLEYVLGNLTSPLSNRFKWSMSITPLTNINNKQKHKHSLTYCTKISKVQKVLPQRIRSLK